MKLCTRCQQTHPPAAFPARTDGRTQSWCAGCLRAAQKAARAANTTANRSKLTTWLAAQHCATCTSTEHVVLLTQPGQRSAAQRLAEGCAWTRIEPQLQPSLVSCRRCVRQRARLAA